MLMRSRTSPRVLVMVAHPDDETLGCGGTIVRLANYGAKVFVAWCTDGVGSRVSTSAESRDRADAADRAVGMLGAEVIRHPQPDFADNATDSVPLLELCRHVELILGGWRPSIVLTHHAGDLNIDHRRVHEAVLTACRPQPGKSGEPPVVSEIYAFETPSSTEWGVTAFRPTLHVDISDAPLKTKLAALACYAAESRPWPHARSERALRALAELRGAQAGVGAAESFEVIRCLR